MNQIILLVYKVIKLIKTRENMVYTKRHAKYSKILYSSGDPA
jgi:hypothetical protein